MKENKALTSEESVAGEELLFVPMKNFRKMRINKSIQNWREPIYFKAVQLHLKLKLDSNDIMPLCCASLSRNNAIIPAGIGSNFLLYFVTISDDELAAFHIRCFGKRRIQIIACEASSLEIHERSPWYVDCFNRLSYK